MPFHRTVIPELMDRPDAQPDELIEDLHDLMKLNRYGWGARLVWDAVHEVVSKAPSQKGWTLLDVATGSADIPRFVVDRARRAGLQFRVTATDLHPVTLDFAREQSREYPEIMVEPANLLALPYAENSFDIVTCSQALHHFDAQQIVIALQQMARIARQAVIISDLRRNSIGYGLVWLLVHLGRASRFAKHDGPASIRNGFKLWELDRLAQQAGLNSSRCYKRRVIRLAMVWMKEGS